jgi:hypothetical protein
LSFAVSLHGSVPASITASSLSRVTNSEQQQIVHGPTTLALTAAPANVSFYEEFYPTASARSEQPKTGMFHWFGSLIKKSRQKIALLSPQKFF